MKQTISMRRGAADAEAERRRRLSSVAVDASVIFEGASIRTSQPLERVTKQLTGQLERALEDRLDLQESWQVTPVASAQDEDSGDEGMSLFSAVGKKRASATPVVLVAARGVADDAQLVGDEVVEPAAKVMRRSDWEKLEEEGDESGELDEAVAVQMDIVEHEEARAAGEAQEDVADNVNFFSDRVKASRPKYERHREPVMAARDRDRAALALLCVDPASLSQQTPIVSVEEAAATLPAAAIVVPHPGEQPPSPDLPQKKYCRPAPTHKRWTFREAGEKQINEIVSARQRKRHPGLVRKLRKTTADMVMVQEVVEVKKEKKPQKKKQLSTNPSVVSAADTASKPAAPAVVATVDLVALARAKKSGPKKLPKNLMLAAPL